MCACADLPPADFDDMPPLEGEEGTQGGGPDEGPNNEFVNGGADMDDDEEEGGRQTVAYDLEFNLRLYVAK